MHTQQVNHPLSLSSLSSLRDHAVEYVAEDIMGRGGGKKKKGRLLPRRKRPRSIIIRGERTEIDRSRETRHESQPTRLDPIVREAVLAICTRQVEVDGEREREFSKFHK